MVRPAVSKLIVPHHGAPVREMPSDAARYSSGAEMVSTQSRSAPPASRPRACSSNMSAAASMVRGPCGAMISPVGPSSPRPAPAAGGIGGLAGDGGGDAVELVGPALGLVQPQPAGVAAEAVGQEQVAAGVDRAVVERADLGRLGLVPELRRLAGLEAHVEQRGAGGAVGQQPGPFGEQGFQGRHLVPQALRQRRA